MTPSERDRRIEARVIARHGAPGSCPSGRLIAREVGEFIPSSKFVADVIDALHDEADWAERGNACQISIEFWPSFSGEEGTGE